MKGTMKRALAAILVLAGLAVATPAQADIVNQFNYQLKDIKANGQYTVVFSSRSYDTTGAVPPQLTRSYQRLPAGAKLRPEFFKDKAHLCDFKTLHDVKNPDVCKSSLIGRGTATADSRLIINPLTGQPYVKDLLPYKVWLFLAKPQVPGAAGSFLIFAEPDLSSPLFNNTGIIHDTKVTLQANFFNDPTPDGRFGVRLEIPVGPPVAGLKVSVAEVNVAVPGRTLTKKTIKCKKKRKGKCVKKSVKKKKLFWFTEPTCPASKQLPFQAFYQYEGIATPQIVEATVPCPAFKR